MPAPEAIASEKERLYESSSLRDDLNDSEATVLLSWGETQVDRLANEFPEEFEQKARFMRQLLKNINRFVGQREFNDREGQEKYMKKISQYLEPLGWSGIGGETLFNVLPEDKADMASNLQAILGVLSPQETTTGEDNTPPAGLDVGTSPDENSPESSASELENPNSHSINQAEDTNVLGDNWYYGEE